MTFEGSLEAEAGTYWCRGVGAGEEGKGIAALYSLSHGDSESHNICGKDKKVAVGRLILCREVWGSMKPKWKAGIGTGMKGFVNQGRFELHSNGVGEGDGG